MRFNSALLAVYPTSEEKLTSETPEEDPQEYQYLIWWLKERVK